MWHRNYILLCHFWLETKVSTVVCLIWYAGCQNDLYSQMLCFYSPSFYLRIICQHKNQTPFWSDHFTKNESYKRNMCIAWNILIGPKYRLNPFNYFERLYIAVAGTFSPCSDSTVWLLHVLFKMIHLLIFIILSHFLQCMNSLARFL